MKLQDMTTSAREALTAKRVFTEAVERDGVTIIGAAAVRGGAGGGHGQDEAGPQGEGGGFGLSARPVGAYVLKDGNVRWVPAVDVNRLVTAIAVLVGILAIIRSRLVRARLKASR